MEICVNIYEVYSVIYVPTHARAGGQWTRKRGVLAGTGVLICCLSYVCKVLVWLLNIQRA